MITLKYTKGLVFVGARSEEDRGLAKLVPGTFYDMEKQIWKAPPSPYTVQALAQTFPNAVDCGGFAELLKESLAYLTMLDYATGNMHVNYMRNTPWSHQQLAYNFAFPRTGTLLGMDMGTGKTYVTLALALNRKHKRTLVLGPKSAIPVWPHEVEKHCSAPLDVLALHPFSFGRKLLSGKKKADLLGHFLGCCGEQSLVAVNYEAAIREPLKSLLLDYPWDFLVADECDMLSDPTGIISQYVYELGLRIPYRAGLTGTPTANAPWEAFGQCRFLEPGIFGSVWTRFKEQWLDYEEEPFPRINGLRDKDRFAERLSKVMYQVHRRDVLDLPPVTHEYRFCSLSDYAPYNELREELYVEIAGIELDPDNALVKTLRLRELTSGFVRKPDGYTIWDEGKYELLVELLSKIPKDEPVVVFCNFTPDLDRIKQAALATGRPFGELSGRRNDLNGQAYPEGVTCLAVQEQAGSRGVDFTKSAYAIAYSISYSGKQYEQMLARQDRPGQTRPVTFYHILTEGTIDQDIYDALRLKKNVSEHILGLVKSRQLR